MQIMNHVVLLAGGIGSRMNVSTPKQYLMVRGIPLFLYSFRKFVCNAYISTIVIVVSNDWKGFVQEWIEKENVDKDVIYANAGASRQHSVYNGLLALKQIANPLDVVLIHDSVRPFFSQRVLNECIIKCDAYDSVLPVLPSKNALYVSKNSDTILDVLDRDVVFEGQSPESFVYSKLMAAHTLLPLEKTMNVHGTSELAQLAGLKVTMIHGDEDNIKITTVHDLHYFEYQLNHTDIY